MSARDRSRLSFKVRHAVRNPDQILPYARRRARDLRLSLRTTDHIGYYRGVMRSDAARGGEVAVGSPTHELWLMAGQMQFDYLLGHGLEHSMRMLEIGCGNLRAGRLFIDYLAPDRYHGIDISPDILLGALDTITDYRLQAKRPSLTLVGDLKLGFLPDEAFDVVHAHSVFSHSPIEVIDECLQNVGRIMAPGGFFDFTFNRTEGAEHHVLREDFYYQTKTLTALAAKYGLRARSEQDWEPLHRQSKLRVTHSVDGLISG